MTSDWADEIAEAAVLNLLEEFYIEPKRPPSRIGLRGAIASLLRCARRYGSRAARNELFKNCESYRRIHGESERVDDAIGWYEQRLRIPDGHIRLPDGRDVRVLGTLPMTADGCVAGSGAGVWVADVGDVYEIITDHCGASEQVGCDTAFWPVEELYSTREAAEAAMKEAE